MMLSTANYSSYQWTNGDTTQSIWVNTSGNYFVTVTDQYGCKVQSYEFTVNAAAMDAPTICIVTVDSILGKNLIVWERPVTSIIDSYYVYKESTTAGKYLLIGKTAYNDLSIFLDTTSDPRVKADRYRITFIDTCGVESAPSPPHKTMHLTINKGINGENNLIWDHYEGFTFNTYEIYRGSNPGNMRPIALIQNSLTSYSDINPPSGLLFYQVSVVKPDPCYPDILRAQTQSGPYSQSVSNIKDYSAGEKLYLSAYPTELYISKEKNSSNVVTVYTNLMQDWVAYVTETWLEIVPDKANHAVIVYANADNTAENPRSGLLVIKSSDSDTTQTDSMVVLVFQRGTVGISNQFNSKINLDVYPNPYVNATNIEFELSNPTTVNLSVYDLYGKPVAQLLSGEHKPGKYNLRFSAAEHGRAYGIYYLVLEANGQRTVKKLIELD
jgi:hypothetical protein